VLRTNLKSAKHWWSRAVVIGGLCACVVASSPLFTADLHDEDEVEAAFLYRIAGYVEWPPEAFSGQDFTIAVLGSDSIARELQRLLPNHSLKNRPAQVRRIRGLDELGDAQILFVGPRYNDELMRLIARVANRPVLVVTASDHGLDQGSCVNFLVIDRRVRFEVSLTVADRVGLKVSSELLSVAIRVQGRSVRPGASDLDIDRSPRFANGEPPAGDPG
jgi:YfiR/HmsC-like